MAYKHIVFDFDGTIGNSQEVVREVLDILLKKYKVKGFRGEDFKNINSLTIGQKVRLLFYMGRLQQEFKTLYGERVHKIPSYPGMLELLPRLRDHGYGLAVITANAAENIQAYFKLRGVSGDIPVRSSSGFYGKAQALRGLAEHLGCRLSEILYIGDEVRDARACNRCGVDIAFVKWGTEGQESLAGVTVKYTPSTPEDLAQLLLNT